MHRIIISFLTLENVNCSENLLILTIQFGEITFSKNSLYDWHKKFSCSWKMVQNVSYSHRSRTSITDSNIRTFLGLTVSEIVSKKKNITDDLGFRKMSVTNAQKAVRPVTCERLLTRYDADGGKFLRYLVIRNEIYHRCTITLLNQAEQTWSEETPKRSTCEGKK